MALLFIDLDHLRLVNPQYGHVVRDELLECVATRITSCVRQSDTITRLGGDEFTVILLDIGVGDTLQIGLIAKNILRKIAVPFHVGMGQACEATISGSIGIALFPEDAKTPEQLLKSADRAMYFAKHSGRN